MGKNQQKRVKMDKNIDHFYNDPLNSYIPIPSAILIANMYAKRMNIENIDSYIKSTRKWINELTLDLDTLNYSKLLELAHSRQGLRGICQHT